MISTASAATIIASLRPPTVLVTTTSSPSSTTQLKPSENLKKILSPTPGPQGLAPLTTPVIATPVPKGQANLTKLVESPAHATELLGVPEQQNAPLHTANAQQDITEPEINMLTARTRDTHNQSTSASR